MTAGGEAVSPLNIPAWRDFPLRSRLEAALDLPTYVDNDAKALALGEGWLGAARGRADFIAMVVSTGVGGGIVLDGRLLDGAQGNAGHIGHLIVEPGRSSVPLREPGLPRGRGVGHRDRGDHRSRPAEADAATDRAHRTARRSGRRDGGGAARPAARGRGRLGGARVRRARSSRPRRPRSTDVARLDYARGLSHRARPGWGPTVRSSAPPRSACGRRP